MSISGTIKSIQDIMWKDAGVDGDAQPAYSAGRSQAAVPASGKEPCMRASG